MYILPHIIENSRIATKPDGTKVTVYTWTVDEPFYICNGYNYGIRYQSMNHDYIFQNFTAMTWDEVVESVTKNTGITPQR